MVRPGLNGTAQDANASPGASRIGLLLVTSFTLTIAATFGFGFYLFPALTTDIRTDIAFSYSGAGLLNAAVQGGVLVGSILSAVVLTVVGAKWVVIGAVVMCAGALVATQTVQTVTSMAVLFFVMGLAAVMSWVPMIGEVARYVPQKHRGKALAIISSGTSFGVLTNALVVPYFVTTGHWRDAWGFAGICTLAIAAMTALVLIAAAKSGRERADIAGGGGRKTAGLADSVHLARSFDVWSIWTLCFLNGFVSLAFQSFLSPYLRDELAFSVDFAGTIWMTIAIVGMGSGFVLGSLSDRFGVAKTMSGCYLLWGAASLIVVVSPIPPSITSAAVLFGLAFYPIFGLVPTYISGRYDVSESGRIFAIGNLILGLGGIMGNAVGGGVRDLSGSFVPVYLLNAALCVAAIAVMVLTNRPSSDHARPHQR